jgi:hypothetical protein
MNHDLTDETTRRFVRLLLEVPAERTLRLRGRS